MALLPAAAQDARRAAHGAAAPDAAAGRCRPPSMTPTEPRATVEADISTRTFEVTTGFSGHEIIVFGAIDNSQAPAEQTGYYDVVVVVEGTPFPIVVRKKSDVAGVWVNTSSITFASVPSYYAITSTKPIEQIAGPAVLERHAIGFRHIAMKPSPGYRGTFKDYELAAFRAAVIRLKKTAEPLRDRAEWRGDVHRPQPVPQHHRAAGQRAGRAAGGAHVSVPQRRGGECAHRARDAAARRHRAAGAQLRVRLSDELRADRRVAGGHVAGCSPRPTSAASRAEPLSPP